MILFLTLVLGFTLLVFAFMQQKKFGKQPVGERLEQIKKSPNYKNGAFQNRSHTPPLTDGATYYSVLKDFMFAEKKGTKPTGKIPSVKTNLLQLNSKEDVLVWFGHSSYFIQIDGKKILVDPVLSGAASPLSFTTRSFNGTDIYTTDDFPEIDYLFITHDHWDHMDHKTILKLKPKIKKIICGLGTGQHLELWGFNKNIIIEKDWDEEIILGEGFIVNTVPARHFSGRTFTRNKAIWLSFVFQTPTLKLFLGGDSGYDNHFAEIGEKFGEFDLVILENGQYNKNWKHIHMMPNEVLQASKELKAKKLFPVHSSKFSLSLHRWDDPLKSITELNKTEKLHLITPMIGEKVNLKDNAQQFSEWWNIVE